MNIAQSIQSLTDEINVAFDGVSREGGITYHQSLVMDNYGTEAEIEAADKDTDQRWQDVSDQDRSYGICLCYCDAVSYRYYLPAYMLWTLRNLAAYTPTEDEYVDTAKINGVVYTLTMPSRPKDSKNYQEFIEYQQKKWSLFSPQQGRAVAHFLQFMAEHTESTYVEEQALKALDEYWGNFLP